MSELRKEFVEEVRNGEYGNSVANELKDFLIEAHDEARDLERQLEEAREKNDILDKLLRKVEGVLSHSEDIRFKDLDALTLIKEHRNSKLKEQG